MIDLAEFLLARYAETEAEARQDDSVHLAPSSTTYILDDLDAKRQIVETYRTAERNRAQKIQDELVSGQRYGLLLALRLLALPYAGHPDYRAEWRP